MRQAIEQNVSGEAMHGEVALLRKRKTNGPYASRDSGKQHQGYDVVVKIIGYFPKRSSKQQSGTIYVRTDKDCLLIALNEKDERVWYLNFDHAKRWCREHERKLQQLYQRHARCGGRDK